jgi:uncharacterized protein (TIGR03086 family)
MPDTTELYRRAVEEFAKRVAKIRDDQWHDATPCADWDVRTLVGHLVYEDLWFVALVRGETIPEVGDRFEGDNLGDDPRGAWDRASAEALRVAGEQGALARTVQLSRGPVPAEDYTWEVLMDHTIHSWDLARGIEDDATIDPTLIDALRGWVPPRLELMRASGGFADPIELAPDASEQDQLLAMLGRRP